MDDRKDLHMRMQQMHSLSMPLPALQLPQQHRIADHLWAGISDKTHQP
jgi:hypothetical protein